MIFTNNYADVSLMEEVLVIFYPALREPFWTKGICMAFALKNHTFDREDSHPVPVSGMYI